jgi:hypothetical protein
MRILAPPKSNPPEVACRVANPSARLDNPDASGIDPADGDHDPRYYYALHNTNYNVQMLVDAPGAGVAVERYEYAPYGERTV